jgi:putative transposase
MLTGISFKAYPTVDQKIVLSQWMGCSRYLWNAKCEEFSYFLAFAKKYCPINTKIPVDQSYSQFKNRTLSPWLFDCPSQILRNTTTNWYKTYKKFLNNQCRKPRKKKKSNKEGIHLTRELFSFKKLGSRWQLIIGTKSRNIGVLKLNIHRDFQEPNSIMVIKENGDYRVSFCYEDTIDGENLLTQKEHLEFLKESNQETLEFITIGIDRGVKKPIQTEDQLFDLTKEQKRKKIAKELAIKKYQRRLSRQKKSSKRRKKTKRHLGRAYKKIQNIRKDFCHKASRSLVDNPKYKVFVLEDLKTKNMTRKPKSKKDPITNKCKKNRARAKAGLNRSILDKGWYMFENFLSYKTHRALKAIYKVAAHNTSQECSDCGHTHPNNRKTQEAFHCGCCGYFENADVNASKVIKKRAIKLMLYSGTELSKRGVLLDKERGAKVRHKGDKSSICSSDEALKKKRLAVYS